MRELTLFEIDSVAGGYEKNLNDSIMVSMIFSALFSSAMGAMSGAFWYLQVADTSAKALAFAASTASIPVLTLPTAIFAGMGFGGCVGLAVGMSLYWTGIVTKPS